MVTVRPCGPAIALYPWSANDRRLVGAVGDVIEAVACTPTLEFGRLFNKILRCSIELAAYSLSVP